MPGRADRVEVYLEAGTKRTFAGSIDWPGWCRGGRDEEAALDALIGAAKRYARALRGTRLGFVSPADPSRLEVVERLTGDASTDFGVPGAVPSADSRPVDETELRRLGSVLRASWRALDAAAEAAVGRTLATGPRGGGRSLPRILEHVSSSEPGYVAMLGRKLDAGDDPRRAVLDALETAVRDGVPPAGPRGGKRWTPRSFVRREAWHVLDHAWEIEDRSA